MGALIPIILRVIGTTAVGWAVSDWFNERKAAQQAQAPFSTSKVFGDNWLKWLLTGAAVAIITIAFVILFKDKKRK